MNKKFASIVAALSLALTLGACSSSASSYDQVTLDEASGIKVTAENAGADSSATTDGAITVGENDSIMISPFTEKGSFHLTITSEDGKKTVYDDDVSGKNLFTIEAEPGVYDVTTSGNGVTGWMTVAAQNNDELAEQNDQLNEVLEDQGIDMPDEAKK